MPFAFAEDLKGGRGGAGGGGTKRSGDSSERRREKETRGKREEKKGKRGSPVSIAICRIADLRNNNDPSAGGG